MPRITLHTSNYRHELINFAQELKKRKLCAIKNEATLVWESYLTNQINKEILHFLQYVAMMANPVYRHSPTLQDLAEGLRNTDVHTYELEELENFLRKNKELNLEGYVTFRMEAYRIKLDEMLYTIVKKINTATK